MSSEGVPTGAIMTVDDATGRYVSWPLTGGEPILGRELRQQRAAGAAQAGYDVPPGYRAVAVPLLPAGAVGGMLTTGDHVDVYGTPLVSRQQSTGSVDASPPDLAAGATVIGRNILVLQLRSDQGQPLDATAASGSGSTVHGLNFGSGKLGSVVLAIPAGDADRYAAAAASMSIYLALDVS